MHRFQVLHEPVDLPAKDFMSLHPFESEVYMLKYTCFDGESSISKIKDVTPIPKPPLALQGVAFAEADAIEIAETLKSQFAVDDRDLHLWINQDATKTRFENDLSYWAATMGPHDRFIFYYAGHGFCANGENRLTVWDSHPTSLANTTVCLREVLLSKLQKSDCSQTLLFIDACAVPIDEFLTSRDILAALSNREFEEFVASREYHAIFMSCSPGEKSFTSPILKHGIWTWYLLQALKGQDPEALDREEWLTDASLKNYLRDTVETFIRERTGLTTQQRPYASVQASHTFQILRFVEKAPVPIAELQVPKLLPENAFFRQRESMSFNRLPGFNKQKGHFTPDSVSVAADQFASKRLSELIASESKVVYDNAKSVLGLKRSKINRTVVEGTGSIDTNLFRMNWTSGQNQRTPSLALITRTLWVRCALKEIPGDFDSIFPVCPDTLVIPIEGDLHFDEIADGLEDLADACGGTFEEDGDSDWVSITFEDRTRLAILISESELVVTKSGQRGMLSLLAHSVQVLAQLGRKEDADSLADRKQERSMLPPGK